MLNIHKTKPQHGKRRFRIDDTAKIAGLPGFAAKDVALSDTGKRDWKADHDTLYFKSKVRTKSALCTTLVLNAITHIDPTIESFKSSDLTEYLNEKYPQIVWDSYTVGRILRNIAEAAELLLAPDVGWDERFGVPLGRMRNGNGAYFYLKPVIWTSMWFHAMIAELRAPAQRESNEPGYFSNNGTWGGVKNEHDNPAYSAGVHLVALMKSKGGGVESLKRTHPDLYTWNRMGGAYR